MHGLSALQEINVLIKMFFRAVLDFEDCSKWFVYVFIE